MLTDLQKVELSDILDKLGETLDITDTQYESAIKSYNAVGNHLASESSELHYYKPEILPQGSFLLGTMIKPINDDDDLDIDLVCQLTKKKDAWTPYDVKKIVGDRLKSNSSYEKMLDNEGRRCWTLQYRRNSEYSGDKYHMDILPAIVDEGYTVLLEKSFSASIHDTKLPDNIAIRITDKEHENYKYSTELEEWMKSNPFGYARWFQQRCRLSVKARDLKLFALNENVEPVPKYKKDKVPLQRIVQILKRHRDMMFKGDEHKPISIIITTLSAQAYNGSDNIIEGLIYVINSMENYIRDEYDPKLAKRVKYIANPVNEEENFADKWIEHPIREENFFKWLKAVKKDVELMTQVSSFDRVSLSDSLKKSFGEDVVKRTFSAVALATKKSYAVSNPTHNFYGK